MRNLYANVSTSFSFLFPSWNYDSTKEIELIKEKIIANHPDAKFSESIRRTFSYDPDKEKEEMLIHTLNLSFSVSEEAFIAQSAMEISLIRPFKHSCIFCSIVSGFANATAMEIKKVNKNKYIFLINS